MTPDHKHTLKLWIAAGLWMVVIAIESTAYLSSEYTSRFLYPIVHFLFGVGWKRFLVWHHYMRKCGHFVGYFILSLLLFRAWKYSLQLPSLWALRWAGIAVLMSALVASLDEWHQSYLPTRTGVFSDVVLDSTAALVAQIAIFLYLRSRRLKMARESTVVQRHGSGSSV